MHARVLCNMSIGEIIATIPDMLDIEFEDGLTIDSTKKELIYSWYFWEMHRRYPNTPLMSKHHVNAILNGQNLTNNTHMLLLEAIYIDVVHSYKLYNPTDKEPLFALIYEITNQVYNEVTKMAEPHVTSIDILDFVGIVEHPYIKEAVDTVEANPTSISECYTKIMKSLNTDPVLQDNALVRAIRANVVDHKQVLQCIGIRGFVAEVDGSILGTPLMSNYTKGMGLLYDYAADSRSAARALYFSEAPLQDAEYFARRLQLLSMVVESIAPGDCGSTRYIPWTVTPKRYDDRGQVVFNGDLVYMVGKHYMTDQGLRTITHDDPALYGQVLQLRSAMYCQHPDPHQVCEVCFGELSQNLSKHVNLGHLCSATMTEQTSQSVLSTKHLLASSVSPDIILGEVARQYFKTNDSRNAYILKDHIRHKSPKLVVNREEASGLIDILNIEDISNIFPSRVSYITWIELQYLQHGVEDTMPIEVSQGNRKANLTIEFLRYLKVQGWETDQRNNFRFDLSNWDFSLPILKLPDMEYSYSDHSVQIANVIESSMKNITERATPSSPISTLQELFLLVNTKLNVNIAALEVILYAVMLPSKDDYRLSRGAPEPVLGIVDLIIKNRSLGAAMAFEGQNSTICNPRSFFKEGRPSHVLDYAIAPYEVVEEHKRKRYI